MKPLNNVDEDNLAQQVMDEMDDIRAKVWRNPAVQPDWRYRLVDADGLEAQRTRLEEMKLELQQTVKFTERFHADEVIRCDEVECAEGTRQRLEFWLQIVSRSKSHVVSLFEAAILDIKFWKQDLKFQRLWIDAASWASGNGHALLARRLEDAYRLFYGARPILNQTESSFAPSGRTVRAIANEIRAKVFGHAVAELEHEEWPFLPRAAILLEYIQCRQVRIHGILEARGLLGNPLATNIGRQLYDAFEAASFNRRGYEVDVVWCHHISAALDAGKVSLAAALMRYYGHFFGRLYLLQGLRIDRPPLVSGHVPDDPSEQQAKRCMVECNPLRAAWINRQEVIAEEKAARECSQALLDAQVPDQRGEQSGADVQP